ncbi:MAG: NADH-quinone oxidoreductase subunit C [Ignavibacteria bacterium]|nr:NADH-quinone oxidoreductase subunit C [Ignavibacteria bacterium]
MDNENLKNIITSVIPECEFSADESQFLNVIVKPEEFRKLAEFLRYDPETQMDYLFCMTAIDWTTHFFTIYHLTSSLKNFTVVIKVKITDRENPNIDTVCDIWKTAEFHEREVYDLFGIKFNNHPDLRRILLEDDWVGYPLRKDYKDEINIVEL